MGFIRGVRVTWISTLHSITNVSNGFSAWQRWVMKADGMLGEAGSTPREWRATFFDRGPGRQALAKVVGWRPKRLLIAHGACALTDGSEVLDHSLAWLTKPWPA